jgi:phosphatidylglycerophosphate synthase
MTSSQRCRRLSICQGAGALGKAATVAQFLAVTLILFRDARAPLAAIAASAIGAAAALAYIVRGVRLARGQNM